MSCGRGVVTCKVTASFPLLRFQCVTLRSVGGQDGKGHRLQPNRKLHTERVKSMFQLLLPQIRVDFILRGGTFSSLLGAGCLMHCFSHFIENFRLMLQEDGTVGLQCRSSGRGLGVWTGLTPNGGGGEQGQVHIVSGV
ncbi:Hypothetical predicted protein [Pelobates cultripes]|uniref:Uncharacterized protein n=1 Tax=Pelobates cultripes TaxID=61616 RepID=A0AAD1SLK8_PELCU|nr:Hypothetical predicted protein [Pelobates cultripes]